MTPAESIAYLRTKVEAAQQEFDMAVTFHEVWKPIAYDHDLHQRMGKSYATNALFVIRTALRREMILALMRLWDTNAKGVRLHYMADLLRKPATVDTIVRETVARMGIPEAEDQIKIEISRDVVAAMALIDKYSDKGSHGGVRVALQELRNERLAHRSSRVAVAQRDPDADEIEAFYQDISEIIRLLLHVLKATAYDPQETGSVFKTYATFFWAGARGERTEGHPNYPLPSKT